jgi:hypothetical protein
VEFGDKFVGDSVMSRCRRIVEIADDFVNFISSDCVVLGDWMVVSFHKIWQKWWSGFCLWWEEGVSEDVVFFLNVVYAI